MGKEWNSNTVENTPSKPSVKEALINFFEINEYLNKYSKKLKTPSSSKTMSIYEKYSIAFEKMSNKDLLEKVLEFDKDSNKAKTKPQYYVVLNSVIIERGFFLDPQKILEILGEK